MRSNVPIVLVHGLGDSAKLFRRMAAHLRQTGREVHCIDLMPNNGHEALDRLALQIRHFVTERFGAGQKLDLLGFSMGGIVSRFYVQRLGGIARVRRFVTISAPHCGTWTAWLRGNAGIRQVRPGSEFLRDLNSDCEILDQTGFVSIWTRFDLMIVPARSSVLPVGRSLHVVAFGTRLWSTTHVCFGSLRVSYRSWFERLGQTLALTRPPIAGAARVQSLIPRSGIDGSV